MCASWPHEHPLTKDKHYGAIHIQKKALTEAKKNVKDYAAMDVVSSLAQSVRTIRGRNLTLFVAEERSWPGDKLIIQPGPGLHNTLCLRTDREPHVVSALFYLFYNKSACRGFWDSDQLHDEWNLVHNAVNDVGMSSMFLSIVDFLHVLHHQLYMRR